VKYKVLLREGIDLVRTALDSRAEIPDLGSYEKLVGIGQVLDEQVLVSLASQIRSRQKKLQKSGSSPEIIDHHCFDLVHESLPADPFMLADKDFWTRFAVVHLKDVILARFPGKKGKVNPDNFGIGARTECWPYKLWVRGDMAYDVANRDDKYFRGRVGGADMWTSHVHRQRFMSARQMFRAVWEFQYPNELQGKPLLFEGEDNPEKGGRPAFRTLVKRLKENAASVEYATLSDEDAHRLVVEHGTGLYRADGKPFQPKT
jgi:hypothetical protein